MYLAARNSNKPDFPDNLASSLLVVAASQAAGYIGPLAALNAVAKDPGLSQLSLQPVTARLALLLPKSRLLSSRNRMSLSSIRAVRAEI